MQLQIITNDEIFKVKLKELNSYFENMERSGVLSPIHEAAYKPLKIAFDIVYNNEILLGNQKSTSTFWPIKDGFLDGEAFLNSEVGILLQEVVYYFSNYYNIPPNQLGENKQ